MTKQLDSSKERSIFRRIYKQPRFIPVVGMDAGDPFCWGVFRHNAG